MIDVANKTTTKRSSRRRIIKKSQQFSETTNGDLSNGSSFTFQDDRENDRSWNFMNYSDYLDYRRSKSGEVEESRVSHSAGDSEEGSKAPGFIFRYYKKFGYYWNVFPKTDYCYLSGSPDYQKEISPGIPKVPNLSRYPLSSYTQRGLSSGSYSHHSTHETDSRLAFSERPLMNSTECERSLEISDSRQFDWHGNVDTRKSLGNHSRRYQRETGVGTKTWNVTKSLIKTIVYVIQKTIVTTITTVTQVSSILVSSNSTGRRSCNWLPMFLFLLLLLPLVYYLVPGVVGSKQEEIVTAVSSPANDFFSWSTGCLFSALNLVKDSLLIIPTIFYQIASLFPSNSSNKSESPCVDLPAVMTVPQPYPIVDFSSNFTEEKLAALQTEIIGKLKTEMAGQNHHLTTWIEQIQDQLAHLSEEMKKMNKKIEGGQKGHFQKLEGELADLKKAVIDVRDQSALGTVTSPSEKIIEKAVAKYHADRTGLPDYALLSSGGYIVGVRCAQTYTKTTANVYIFGLPMPWAPSNGPETIIKPGVMPGECWAFEGSFAQVTLHLATKVKVTSFTLEHSPKELALHGHISSAPKQFSVWALENEKDTNPVFLGRFSFLDNGESLQQFEAIEHDEFVDLIELKVESNHGHPEYTCLYRFRVHGVPSTLSETNGNKTGSALTSDAVKPPHMKPYR